MSALLPQPAARTASSLSEAVEVVGGRADAPIVLLCEHASEELPAPYRWPEEDRWLLGTHWAYDLGAAAVTRAIAARCEAPAVLTRYSRLLVDANRAPDSDTLFRPEAEGRAIALNRDVAADDRARRMALHEAYHRAVDEVVAASNAPTLVAVHSFTPVYEGQVRSVELGVLFDRDEALAVRLAACFAEAGIAVELNVPYSGRAGMIYSADRHARAHGRATVELELRQDLVARPDHVSTVVDIVARFFG